MPGVNIIRNTEYISIAPNYFLIFLFAIVNNAVCYFLCYRHVHYLSNNSDTSSFNFGKWLITILQIKSSDILSNPWMILLRVPIIFSVLSSLKFLSFLNILFTTSPIISKLRSIALFVFDFGYILLKNPMLVFVITVNLINWLSNIVKPGFYLIIHKSIVLKSQ